MLFFRIPKILFTDPKYQDLCLEAKVVFGAMLDKMSLSIRNHKIDKDNRVYIFFTQESVQQLVGCGRTKAQSIINSLIEKRMIKSKRRGLGKSNMYYVLKIDYTESVSDEYMEATDLLAYDEDDEEEEDVEFFRARKMNISRPSKRSSTAPENGHPKDRGNAVAGARKTNRNYNPLNKTDLNKTDSVSHSFSDSYIDLEAMIDRVMDRMESPNERKFLALLNDVCDIPWWKNFYEGKATSVLDARDVQEVQGAEHDEIADPWYLTLMVQSLVRVFIGDPSKPVRIRAELINRKNALIHLCRHNGRQMYEAYSTAVRYAQSGNTDSYALSTLYFMDETVGPV